MSSATPTPPHGLKRRKKSRSNQSAAQNFLIRHRLLLTLLGCLGGGIVFLLNPWPMIFMGETTGSTWVNLQTWVAHGGGSELLGGLLLLSSFPLGLLFMRRSFLYDDRFWRRNGCPRCGRDDLHCTSRLWYHRLLNKFGLPVRHYSCAQCHWTGGRIDEGQLSL